jgi:beta-glucanase (GH16 family)
MKASTKVFLQLFVILVLIVSALGVALSASAKPSALGTWTLQWADEFNGSGAVSGTDWIYDLGHCYPGCPASNWGTGELENMTSSTANVNQTGGHLSIIPVHTGNNPGGGWTSGRIETQRSDFQPPAGGAMAIEASIQQPNVSGAAAKGYWPAFWALGAPFRGVYTNWPGIGELDILEDINGQSNVFSTLHCGTSPGGPCNETTGLGSGAHACPGCQTGYHTYRFEFDKSVSPQQMRWYLDGSQYWTVNANQVDATTWANATNHGFFIILNVAIGGGWPGNPTRSTASGVPMNVDYVRVYYAP